jgi:ABC-type polysaccharide transport system permease subunit
VVQLILLAFGMGISLVIRNQLVKNNSSKTIAVMITLPVFLLFVFIAFFKYSELRLHEFIAKMIKTHFLDATLKYQINYEKMDPELVLYAKNRSNDHENVAEVKDLTIDKEKLKKLRGFGG